jgi:hypothetical protein
MAGLFAWIRTQTGHALLVHSNTAAAQAAGLHSSFEKQKTSADKMVSGQGVMSPGSV